MTGPGVDPSPTTQPCGRYRRLLNEKKAAAVLDVSDRTLQSWRLKGGGPPFLKLNGCVRYDAAALDAWIDSRSRASTSDPGPAA